eukprot:gb/GEZN01006256.1/.p1 GENE.gb/GEZN01006256.1/~~gb/GEZN01006256.1/.p1  ORF type:complete len:517 (-),score=83.86 gb/GEZN01006256.1/:73-1623(-)
MSDTLKCAGCFQSFPKETYSGSQLKKKGKRKCITCCATTSSSSDASTLQSTRAVSAEEKASETAKQEAMIKWLEDNGANISPLLQSTCSESTGLGFCAKANMDVGDVIIQIPEQCIMTLVRAKQSPIGQRIADSQCDLISQQSVLASWILTQKKDPSSFFSPYLSALPSHFSHCPVMWPDSDLKELKGSCCVPLIQQRRKEILEDYARLCQSLGPTFQQQHSKADFLWARLAILSRVYETRNTDSVDNEGMVPFLDNCNHSVEPMVNWRFDETQKKLNVVAIRHIQAGQSIQITYGNNCNSRYLINYGFCLDHNPYNTATFLADVQTSDPFASSKKASLSDLPREFQISPCLLDGASGLQCFSYLRIIFATGAELHLLAALQKKTNQYGYVPPLSIHNELKVCEELASQSNSLLAKFATTLEEDSKLLPTSRGNMRNAIVQRSGEKAVLRAFTVIHPKLQEIAEKKVLTKEHIAWAKETFGQATYFDRVWVPLLRSRKERELLLTTYDKAMRKGTS